MPRNVMIDGEFRDELQDQRERLTQQRALVTRRLQVINAKLLLVRRFEKEDPEGDAVIIETGAIANFPWFVPEVADFNSGAIPCSRPILQPDQLAELDSMAEEMTDTA